MRISDWSSDVCSSDLVVEAHQLAQVGLHVLRGIELLPLARRDPQLAVAAEQQAVAVVAAAADLGQLAPDPLQAFKRAAAAVVQRQRAARDRPAAGVALAGNIRRGSYRERGC